VEFRYRDTNPGTMRKQYSARRDALVHLLHLLNIFPKLFLQPIGPARRARVQFVSVRPELARAHGIGQLVFDLLIDGDDCYYAF
jgi:hypothetical protein